MARLSLTIRAPLVRRIQRTAICAEKPRFIPFSMKYSIGMWRGLPLLLCLLACCASFGQERKEGALFSYSIEREIEALGLPSQQVKSHALFYFSDGPAAGSLTVVPPSGLDPGQLRTELALLLTHIPQARYSIRDSGSLQVQWNNSRVGLRSSSLRLPLTDLSAWMERNGASSSFIVKTSQHVQIYPQTEPTARKRGWKTLVIRGGKSDLELFARVNAWQIAGLIALALWLPLILLTSHAVIARSSRRTDLSKKQKAQITNRWFIYGHGIGAVPIAPLFLCLFLLGGLDGICGLWFGFSNGNLALAVLLLISVILPATLSFNSYLDTLRDARKSEAAELTATKKILPEFVHLVLTTKKTVRLRTWGPWLGLIPLLAAMGLGASGRLSDLQAVLLALSSLLGLGFLLVKDPRMEAALPDLAETQSITNSLTQKLGMPVVKVVPEVRKLQEDGCTPREDGPFMTVSESFTASFTSQEQEFLIAEHLIKKKKTRFPIFAVVVLTLFSLTLNIVLTLISGDRLSTFLGVFVPLLLSLGMTYLFARARERVDAQTEAAILTGNLEAALSAKRKIRTLLGQDGPETEEGFQKELDDFAAKVRAKQLSPTRH